VAAAAGALLGAMTLLGCRAGSVPGAPADPAAAQSAGAPGGAHPRIFLTAEVRAKADQAKADIISGKIQVHDYMSDNKCPS